MAAGVAVEVGVVNVGLQGMPPQALPRQALPALRRLLQMVDNAAPREPALPVAKDNAAADSAVVRACRRMAFPMRRFSILARVSAMACLSNHGQPIS